MKLLTYHIIIKLIVIFAITFCSNNIFAQFDVEEKSLIKTENNYRIYPSNVTQTEVFITKSPLDENFLFSSCNTLTFIPFFISEGVYTTEDAGHSWQGSDSCAGDPISFHGGDPGIAIDKNGRLILTRLGRSPFVGLYSHFSDDNGTTWSQQKVISTEDLERASVTTDAVNSSSYFGRTYATWVKFASPFPIMMSFTNDGAENWSTPQQINTPPKRSAGGDIALGSNGEVYTCWAGVTESSPFKEIYVGFASSTNGTENWDVSENAYEMNGITGLLANKGNIRVNGLPGIAVDNSGGERDGWIYIVTGEKDLTPAGSDPDIIIHRSSDGGVSWSTGIRVNQDALNNGKTQYFPSIHVDKFGAIDIIYYDDRNTSIDSTGVFLSRSLDGGDSWQEFEISDHNFKPVPIGGLGQGYQGDNIDLSSTETKIIPVWMDNSTGIYQIWTAPISFSFLNDIEENKNLSFELNQNFPNPFRFSTTINFHLSEADFVSLKVYNAMGKLMETLINEDLEAGNHKVYYSVENSNSKTGVYFYQLNTGKYSDTKTMILSH